LTSEGYLPDTNPKIAPAFDEDTGSGLDVGHTPIDAFGSIVADCTSMLDTSAAASVPVGEHTWADHVHEFAATKPMPERPIGAYGRSGDKVVACVRLPRP
jgi:hypothetical protein